MVSPLLERIERKPKVVPIGNRRPVWLRRVNETVTEHKFTTADIYVNGAWQSPNDGGAA